MKSPSTNCSKFAHDSSPGLFLVKKKKQTFYKYIILYRVCVRTLAYSSVPVRACVCTYVRERARVCDREASVHSLLMCYFDAISNYIVSPPFIFFHTYIYIYAYACVCLLVYMYVVKHTPAEDHNAILISH